jgi:DNA mismatch endonuclease (patch repair protein)
VPMERKKLRKIEGSTSSASGHRGSSRRVVAKRPQVPESPPASSGSIRRSMVGNRRAHTKPELAARRVLFASGHRYRVDYRIVAGDIRTTADIVFVSRRVAVFCDGCYWYVCPIHGRVPATNRHYWAPKLLRNQRRDVAVTEALRRNGWRVIRVWEHEAPGSVVRKIERALSGRPPRRITG